MKSLLLMRFNVKLPALFLFLTGVLTVFGAGEVDTSFKASVTATTSTSSIAGEVTKILIQPDGKILVGGGFRTVNGVARSGLTRLNPDGTIDPTFALLDFRNTQEPGGNIFDIALQSNGKILVAGDFVEINGIAKYRLVRLNTDGTIDETFAPQPISDRVNDIAVQPDDKIIIGGAFQYVTPTGSKEKIVRLNADGTLDTSINYASEGNIITNIVIQPDGKLVISTTGTLFRYSAAGSIDGSFGPLTFNGQIFDLQAQADGKVLVGGSFTTVNGFAVARLMRITADGAVDGTFANSGPDNNVRGIFVAPDGRIAIGGNFSNYSGTPRKRVAILTSNGTLDPSFNYTGPDVQYFNDVAIQTDGKVLAGGPPNVAFISLVRANTDGSLDTAFTVTIRINGVVQKVFVQTDGKILVGGSFRWANEIPKTNLVRFNADGTLDTSFIQPILNNYWVYGIDVQTDGKILIGARDMQATGVGLAVRLNSNGSFDRTLSTFSTLDIKALPNGQILLATDSRLRRLNSDGTTDATFDVLANNGITKILLQSDGKILICGGFTNVNGTASGRIARLNPNGTVESSFSQFGGANDVVNDIALQADGKIVVGGIFSGINFDINRKYLARLNSDGSLDTGFTPTVEFSVPGFVRVSAVKIQPDGKIVFGGDMITVNGVSRRGIARLNSNSTLDTSFNPGRGTNNSVLTIDLQADGKIVYGGYFSITNGFSTPGIGRLLNTTAPPRKLFDYDGDGKTDIAVFRPSNGDWWYLSSINNAQVNIHWGQAGDIPRPSDFDGDGKADFIVYRPSNSVWYRYSSTGATSILAFGIAEDKPLIGDFDGDSKSDPAIFRPSTGDWWYASSINGQFVAVHWGANGDIPVPADYDGDGKTDFAVYRPSNGGWYIVNSSNGSFNIQAFGLAEDKPVSADYDGDGKADIAVFRPSTGTWYLLQTTAGFGALQFGVSTDVPTEYAFLQ